RPVRSVPRPRSPRGSRLRNRRQGREPGRGATVTLWAMSEPTPARIGAAPTEPSTAYMAQLDEEREVALRTQSHPGSDHEGAPAALLSRLEEEIDRLGPELVETMIDLAEHPEAAFEEHRSAAA